MGTVGTSNLWWRRVTRMVMMVGSMTKTGGHWKRLQRKNVRTRRKVLVMIGVNLPSRYMSHSRTLATPGVEEERGRGAAGAVKWLVLMSPAAGTIGGTRVPK